MYEFKEQDAFDFAKYIHARTREHNGELSFRLCPYCNPKPSRGNLNTFSINLKTGQFKCLRGSCGVSGNEDAERADQAEAGGSKVPD